MALGQLFLAGKPAWVQQAHSEAARERVAHLRATRQLRLCTVTIGRRYAWLTTLARCCRPS